MSGLPHWVVGPHITRGPTKSVNLNLPAGAGQPFYPEVMLGPLISVLPMIILFPLLQKYVARALTLGAVAGE